MEMIFEMPADYGYEMKNEVWCWQTGWEFEWSTSAGNIAKQGCSTMSIKLTLRK